MKNKKMFMKMRMAAAAMAAMLMVGSVAMPAMAAEVPAESGVQAETTPTPVVDIYSVAGDPSVVVTNKIENWPQAPDITSTAGCIMDADTGAILYNKNMDKQMYPASVTKVMTCLIALKNHENLDDQVTMTQTGVDYAVSGSANLYTQVGEVFTLRDMLYGMMLASANDISTQIAEYVGGSVDAFVKMMNDEAKRLGCTTTQFHNACGMPDDQHWTSAHDLALIGQEAIKNDMFRQLISTPSYTIPATNMTASRNFGNHHPFLVNPDYPYEGIIGGKTGYIDASGNTLITFVERNGVTLICVTLQANGMDPELKDQKAILDYAYANFSHINAEAEEGTEITSGGTLTVPNGVNVQDLTVSTTSDQRAIWKYNGQTVGTATVKELPAESQAESTSESTASVQAVSDNSVSDNQSAPTSKWADTKVMGHSLTEPFSILLIGLGSLIVIGILAIIITVLVKRRK